MGPLLKICAVNFWDGFSLESGFVKYLLDLALDSFLVVPTQQEADIVLTTPFTFFAPSPSRRGPVMITCGSSPYSFISCRPMSRLNSWSVAPSSTSAFSATES